ncbi:MAG: Lrp/AsnC family transcriptional regulator [Parvularculaceae bacterium]|nr:Lrp/AsnC family transcriptional regulator [Parvularculaceae bacterium]
MQRTNRQIDAVDQRLIAALKDDARISMKGLAGVAGLSRSATVERVRRLERDGVIAGYTIRTRERGDALQAWLMLKLAPDHDCPNVAKTIAAIPEVAACYSLAGAVDALVLIASPNVERLSEIRDIISAIPSVTGVQTHPVLTRY